MEYMPLIWAVSGILMVLSEFVVPGFVIFFFGLGALLNALLTWLVPGVSGRIPLQILLWLATSGLSLGLLRRFFARVFRGTLVDVTDDSEYVGKHGTVVEPVAPDKPGRVAFQGTTWRAISYDEMLEVGQEVEIIKKESMSFVVSSDLMSEESPEKSILSDDDSRV